MAIYKRLTREEIKKRFTHCGFLLLAPVYLDMTNPDETYVAGRNWIPEWWVELNGMVLYGLTKFASYIFWDWKPGLYIWAWRLK